MIRSRLALALIVLGAGAATAAEVPEFALEQIAPGVFVHFGQPLPLDAAGHDDIANIGFIIGEGCVAGIDNGGSRPVGPPPAEQIIGPDQLVRDPLELDLGGRHLHLKAWPTAHTDCDLSVLEDRSGTLWTGDLLFLKRLPAVDGDVAGWLDVIDQLERLKVQRAVPGHGPL